MTVHEAGRRTPQLLLTVFLALTVAVGLAAGVRVAYPASSLADSELRELNDQQAALDRARVAAGSLSASHEAIYTRVSEEIAAKKRGVQAGRDAWVLNTGLILIALGSLLMGVSLILGGRLFAVSDGLMLGGLAAAWYGAVWSLIEGASGSRFLVAAAALVVTLAFVYGRFVRARHACVAAPAQ